MVGCGRIYTVVLGLMVGWAVQVGTGRLHAAEDVAPATTREPDAPNRTKRIRFALGLRGDVGTRNRVAADLGFRLRDVAQIGVMGSYASGQQWSYHCDFGCSRFDWWSVEPYLELRAWSQATLTPYGRVSAGVGRLTFVDSGRAANMSVLGHLELGLDLHENPGGASCRLFSTLGGLEGLNNFDAGLGLQVGYLF